MKFTKHEDTQPLDNTHPEWFGSSGFPEKHSHASPRGAERAEHPLPPHVKGQNPHVTDGDDPYAFSHVGSGHNRHDAIEADQ
jgi:hypothetical protein